MAQKTFNCIIVDDETLAQELLKSHIAQIPELHLVTTCHTAIEAMTVLKEQAIDILFLDIQMPNLTGIDFLKTLNNPPLTVFTTAYSEYAIEGFELDAADYLLKPITFKRFFKTTTKLLERLTVSHMSSEKQDSDDFIFVKADGKAVKINFNTILMIESLQKYVRFFTTSGTVVTLMSLTKLESILPASKFMRIHKSYIVNLSKISSIEGNRAHIDTCVASISKTIKPELMRRIDKHNLL